MTLGPAYEDGGRWWQDVRVWEPGDEMPKGYQYARKPGKWTNGRAVFPDDSVCILAGVPYRIPAIPHQTPPEATPTSSPALPITLTADSPEPPYKSVVVVGAYRTAYQRRRDYAGWIPTGGTEARSLATLIRNNDQVVLVYVPPEKQQ